MQRPALEIQTRRLFLQVPALSAASRLADYCTRNREHLGPWEPPRPEEYFSQRFWERQIAGAREEYDVGASVRTVLVERIPSEPRQGRHGPVIGVINLSQIVRGGFQAGVIGYSLDAEAQGRGLMTEGITAMVEHAFTDLGLHRVMANYRPENERSAKVLERLGFEREGFAKEYLFIDGAWRDHVLTSLVKPSPAASTFAEAPEASNTTSSNPS